MQPSSRRHSPLASLLCVTLSACIYAPGLSGESSTGSASDGASTSTTPTSTGASTPCEETRSFTDDVCFCPLLTEGCVNCMSPVSVCEQSPCPPPVTWCRDLSFDSDCTVRSFSASFALDHFSAGDLTLSLRRKDKPSGELELVHRPGMSAQDQDGTLAEFAKEYPITVVWPEAAADPSKVGECWPSDLTQICGGSEVAGCSGLSKTCTFRPSDPEPDTFEGTTMNGVWALCITHWTALDYVKVAQLDLTLRNF